MRDPERLFRYGEYRVFRLSSATPDIAASEVSVRPTLMR